MITVAMAIQALVILIVFTNLDLTKNQQANEKHAGQLEVLANAGNSNQMIEAFVENWEENGNLEQLDEAQIDGWHDRVEAFAETMPQSTWSQEQLTQLADKTTSMMALMGEAQHRNENGLSAYTAETEFNTMMLIITLEREFDQVLGSSFSSFLEAQGTDNLRSLILAAGEKSH
jgi:hypothetical protein